MKICITIICCLISLVIFSQKGIVYIGLGTSYEEVKYVYNTQIQVSSDIKYENEDQICYGLTFTYQPSDNLSITSGALLSSLNIMKDYNWFYIDQGDLLIPRSTTVKADYLRVPLMVGKRIGNGKIEFMPSAGFNFDILVKSTETSIFEFNNERESNYFELGFRNPHTFFTVDFLVSINTSDKISIGIAPYLNQGLNVLNDQITGRGESNFGGRFNVSYKLK